MLAPDEKRWILYDNVVRKRSWGKAGEPPKPNILSQKFILFFLWNFKVMLYYELFPQNQTVNSDVY